ncbi:MAG: PQQ-dependent sugar dehydrogenase [Myxococcota bacterium]
MRRGGIVGVCALLLVAFGVGCLSWMMERRETQEPSLLAFGEYCASCHGPDLRGGELGPPLVDVTLQYGESTEALIRSIGAGFPERGMPAFGENLPSKLVKGLALYVSEQRQGFGRTSQSWVSQIPEAAQRARDHAFHVELVTKLDSRPYSIAPLPDGGLLLTEIVRGLSIIDVRGEQGPLVTGTPRVWEPLLTAENSYLMMGVVLDVALHPDYEENGWIYLSHTDRCQLECGFVLPKSMVRVVRGRIRDGSWVDQEVIWSVDPALYTIVPDTVSAGRLAFDHAGHVYVSIGGKATYDWVQWIDKPTGKIHRVRDDGEVPKDNPFAPDEDVSTAQTVWSYGHRTPQGLASHPVTGAIWGTEMGPRGGDEVNLIQRGGNYGWPMFTNGLDYDGEPVTIGQELGLELAIEDTIEPVVDFTPAPAISSFEFYRGDAFASWENDLIVGTLKARTLYRLRIEDGALVEQEKLLTGLARIRDVEIGADGFVYLLLEHGEEGSIVRLVPAAAAASR